MQKRIGVYGVNEEVLRLAQLLATNPDVSLVRYWSEDREAALRVAYDLGPEIAAEIGPLLTDDPSSLAASDDLDGVIDSGIAPPFAARFPEAAERGIQIVSPLTARLLWAYGVTSQDRKAELLLALSEIVESVDLAIDSDELFSRMLDIAVGTTGAEGGSLMLLSPNGRELQIRVASGVEPELWPKIRVPVGDGIAGKVAADARPVFLRGRADAESFNIVRERFDVESAICVPLMVKGKVLGVLNLHHSSRADAFLDEDLDFLEQLAVLDAQIIARAQEREALGSRAARYEAVSEVRRLLAGPASLLDRLTELCVVIAERVGDGIATVYLHDEGDEDLRLAATSLEGGGFGGEYRVVRGQGIDGRVALTGEPAYLRGQDGALAYLCVPLQAGERILGVLTVQTGEDPPRGRAAEEVLLEMAAAMAEGIGQAKRESRMAIRATRASAINEAGIRMISADDISEVARLATSSSAMIFEAEHAVLRLQDDQTLRYVIRSYFGPADGRQQEKLFRFDKRISVEAIRRRTAFMVRNLEDDPDHGLQRDGIRSVIAAPLKREGRVIGTLSIYDKVAPDRFYPANFNDDDFASFSRFCSYAERAVDSSLLHSFTRRHGSFDEETGLHNARYLARRIDEEISRADGRHGAIAIATCQIENLDKIREQGSVSLAHKVTLHVAEALRTHIRDFDVLGRSEPNQFSILMPDPGHAPDQRIAELGQTVADTITQDEALCDPIRPELAFGYAVYPSDGEDREALLESAKAPRIHLV